MKNIKDIASGGKFVPWESLAGPIDENFAELNNGKLSKSELAQTTGSSTATAMSQNAVTNALSQKIGQLDLAQGLGEYKTVAMSQDAITEALAGLLPNQRADKTPYISVVINDGDSGQNWETFNRKLDEIASMHDPMPYNGDIRYFISEGLRVDVTNRIFDSSEGASRRLTQVVTGNVRLDDRLDIALNGDIDQSFWRIYKEGAWSGWSAVNSGGESDRIYFTSLDVTAIDNGATVSLDEAGELGNIQLALESKKTIISSAGVLAASVSYRRPSLIVSMSYVIGSELRILSTATPRTGGGTWTVKTQDLSNLSGGGGGGIPDVTGGVSGVSYERVQGMWVSRSYYADGDLGVIKSSSDYDKLNDALGDSSAFIEAVSNGLRIYCTEISESGNSYKTNTEIMYQKRDDLSLLELSWIINGIMTIMTVDVSDGWGDITEFKQVDLKNISGTTDKKIVSWDISNIISQLKSGSNVTAGSYTAPGITPIQLRDIVLVGMTDVNADTGASTYLSAQKEHVGDEYILWLSYIAKDKLIRFGVSLGPSAASWGDINASNYKEITIG